MLAGAALRFGAIVLGLSLALLAATPAHAGKRVALVIGVGGYTQVQALKNPPNDAKLIADTLRASGFTLVGDGPQVDLDHAGFERVLHDFGRAIAGADVALFYYSGHGVQVLDTNWLLPTDADPQKPADLLAEGVDVSEVLKLMELSQARLNVVLLDACRNDPFLERGLRSTGGRGLMRMDAPDGTVISYATKPGHVAQDGAGDDSPYTTALAQVMRQPGVPILSMFNRLGLAVKRATEGGQEPWLSASPIDEAFTFGPKLPDGMVAPSVDVPPPEPASPPAVSASAPQDRSGGGAPGPQQTVAAAAEAPPAPPPAPKVWEWVDQSLPARQDSPVRAEPSDTAPPVGQIAAGTQVYVVGALQDKDWLQVRVPQTQAPGYVRSVAVPEPPPASSPAVPAAVAMPAPPPVSGRPVVHDTATLLVEDRVVALDGLEGFGGALADALQAYLDSVGGFVACTRDAGPKYHCVTRDGLDVASVALVNGVARMLPDAPDTYRVQQEDARRNGRGLWAASAPPPPPPPPAPPPAPDIDLAAEFWPAPEAADAPDPGAAAPDGADYGLAVIDGQPVTVIDGERVVLAFDAALGWGYHDAAMRWHAPPDRVGRDLGRRFGDRRPPPPGPRFARAEGPDRLGRPDPVRGPDLPRGPEAVRPGEGTRPPLVRPGEAPHPGEGMRPGDPVRPAETRPMPARAGEAVRPVHDVPARPALAPHPPVAGPPPHAPAMPQGTPGFISRSQPGGPPAASGFISRGPGGAPVSAPGFIGRGQPAMPPAFAHAGAPPAFGRPPGPQPGPQPGPGGFGQPARPPMFGGPRPGAAPPVPARPAMVPRPPAPMPRPAAPAPRPNVSCKKPPC